jgi:hypothetical protein
MAAKHPDICVTLDTAGLPIFLAANIDRDEDSAKWLLNSDA